MIDPHSIREATILDGLTPSEIQEIADIAREEHFQKGARVFSRGDTANNFYIVDSGRFALTIGVRIFDAHEEVAVEAKMAGDAFGWSALVDPFDSIYSAFCMLEGSVIALPCKEFEGLLASDMHLGNRFSRNLNQLIGSRVRAMQDLWIAEVEQHKERVDHWIHTRLSDDVNSAIKGTQGRGHRRFSITH